VVEDEEGVRQLASDILEMQGYKVLEYCIPLPKNTVFSLRKYDVYPIYFLTEQSINLR
jgi:DNA-binding response OmpR family regulator